LRGHRASSHEHEDDPGREHEVSEPSPGPVERASRFSNARGPPGKQRHAHCRGLQHREADREHRSESDAPGVLVDDESVQVFHDAVDGADEEEREGADHSGPHERAASDPRTIARIAMKRLR
jgi:hypothetical protein